METGDIIEKLEQPTACESSLATAVKPNGRVYKDPQQLNKALKRERYLTPLLTTSCRCYKRPKCSVVDLKSGYWHVWLDRDSYLKTTFNTGLGCYRWLHLPFGVNVSAEIFQ